MSGFPSLKALYGDYVELSDERDASAPYRILAELTVNGGRYAVLQSEEMMQEDEVDVFRIVAGADGGLQLETVEADDEWDAVAEAYDDSRFGNDDRP